MSLSPFCAFHTHMIKSSGLAFLRLARTMTRACQAGGSAGIGKACALAFNKNGCKVAIVGRRRERLDTVVTISPFRVGCMNVMRLCLQVKVLLLIAPKISL